MIAGPSEIVVVADESAEPDFAAADLLSQAEHGSGLEMAILLTTSKDIAYAVQQELNRQVEELEHSEDIYSAFKQMAQATGGFVESSANPESLFKRAVDASANYYLLYYSPKNYKGEGKFREINVRVKDKDYRVIHRAGYFDN